MPNVMYHFIGCDASLKGISLKKFRTQLSFLLKTYPRDEIVITFDHGTIDHIENAAPELEKRGIIGMFFILTMTQEEQRVPFIDKQRQIEAFLRYRLAEIMCAEIGIAYCPEDAQGYLSAFGFYSLEERYLRYLRDKILPKDVYEGFIGKHFKKMFGDENDFASLNYLNWHHVMELHKRGHIIGSHSHYHIGDKNDFSISMKLIEARTKQKMEYISYPNGIKNISDEDLDKLEIRKAYLSSGNSTYHYKVGRIDCNMLMPICTIANLEYTTDRSNLI